MNIHLINIQYEYSYRENYHHESGPVYNVLIMEKQKIVKIRN
jgi:hypothetical protein